MTNVIGFRAFAAPLFGLVLSATFPGIAAADPIAIGAEHCVVNVRTDDRLNVRAAPGTWSPIIAGWRYAQCGVLVASCTGAWCRAEDGHYAGWVNRHYIAMVSPALYCVTGVAAADWLNLRAFPSAQSRVLVRLGPRQCGIAFLPYATGGWQKVRVAGWEGWVNRRYVSGQ